MEPSEYLDLKVVNLSRPSAISFKHPQLDNKISVIIPVKNDVDGIVATISSLASHNVVDGGDFEILVCCDGGSKDVAEHCRRSNIRYIEGPGFGSYSARNAGIENSTGEYLAFIDADVEVTPQWVQSVLEIRATDGYDYFGGPIEHKDSKVSKTLTESYLNFAEFPCEMLFNRYNFFPTGNMVVKRSVIQTYGGFDSRLRGSGDLEFGQRISSEGVRGKFIQNLKVFHPFRNHKQLINKLYRQVIADRALNYFYPKRYPSLGAGKRYYEAIRAILAIRTLSHSLWVTIGDRGWIKTIQLFIFAKYISVRRALISIRVR